jgi:hypothetical protein
MVLRPASIEAVMESVDHVRERLLRATAALETAGVSYAVIGGNAVAAWIRQVQPGAVRFTQDVDLMVERRDIDSVKTAIESAGFHYVETLGIHIFLDGPTGSVKDGVHVLFSNEKVRPDYVAAVPDLSQAEYESFQRHRILSLASLVGMKLTSFRRKDQVHIQDLIGVGLIDSTWPARFQPELAARLQELLDDPDG